MLTFPSTRPIVRITRSKNTIRSVDCPELQWWFVVPRLQEDYAYAHYDSETLVLDRVVELFPIKSKESNDRQVVRIDVRDNWFTEKEKHVFAPRMRLLASLDSGSARFLAVTNLSNDGNVIDETTQGDPYFEDQWGTRGRYLENNGKFEQQCDGSWRTTDRDGLGVGTYDVTIGDNRFECLRVFDYDPNSPFGGELGEAYVEGTSGRTVFYREYSGRFLRNATIRRNESLPGVDILELYPNNARIVIDGELYVHCGCTMRGHDTITLAGLGAFNL